MNTEMKYDATHSLRRYFLADFPQIPPDDHADDCTRLLRLIAVRGGASGGQVCERDERTAQPHPLLAAATVELIYRPLECAASARLPPCSRATRHRSPTAHVPTAYTRSVGTRRRRAATGQVVRAASRTALRPPPLFACRLASYSFYFYCHFCTFDNAACHHRPPKEETDTAPQDITARPGRIEPPRHRVRAGNVIGLHFSHGGRYVRRCRRCGGGVRGVYR